MRARGCLADGDRWLQVHDACQELCAALGLSFMIPAGSPPAKPKPNGWVVRLTAQLHHLDTRGELHFGGGHHDATAVALWWLAGRVRDDGWDRMRVTSYVSQLGAERRQGRCPR